jgi:hypothetical protein
MKPTSNHEPFRRDDMKTALLAITLILMLEAPFPVRAQQRNYTPGPMLLDVNRISMSMNRLMGDGGLQSQFSWNLTPDTKGQNEIFYWPADQWQSNMLYQIFNPLSLDDAGILDENGVVHSMFTRGDALTNYGKTDWALETRRYRPPHIVVDGIGLDPPYRWAVDRTLPSDIKLEFEDVLGQFGIRSHVEVYAFSNPDHGDYFIWKATHKFTGEIKLPRESSTSKDTLPDQAIRFWWPIAFSFGPSKAGEYAAMGGFAYEGEDDLDSWFKRKSDLVTGRARDSLAVAFYWDSFTPNGRSYPNGSKDDGGDPDRLTGSLMAPQITGYALLHADRSATDRTDDAGQPYAMPHASIVADLWGRRDVGLKQTYRGDDSRGRFPPDPITAGFSPVPQKGPMRFITAGPYTLTKDRAAGRIDSISFVYAVGAGSISFREADSIGRLWYAGAISDSVKDSYVLRGRDSLWRALDRANWAWDRLTHSQPVPAAPPPPDISVTSGPDLIQVDWSYPDASYFRDAAGGVDDWRAWRVYRKRGAYYVNDPLDQSSGSKWELLFETTNRGETTYIDRNVQRGVDYYYAVTAVDDGTLNTGGPNPGKPLESSLYATRSQLPATSFKPGLSESGKVRVVPNPATVASGALGFSGTPDKILFVNLPVKCKLQIYTETGDLVTTIQHYGTADHSWDQRTDANQYVVSGIYILAVTESTSLDGKALDNQFVKFVIVR